MAEEVRRPGYIAVLPAKVRYDSDLAPNAKLLYAEITALADDRGYCFCWNEYFSRLFGLAVKSVSRLISQLSEKGYIRVEVIRSPESKIVVERRIWVDTPPRKKEDTPSPQNCGEGPRKKEGSPPRRIAEKNDLSSFNDIPPISPRDKLGLSSAAKVIINDYCPRSPEITKALYDFMEVRVKRKAVNSDAAIERLLVKLDKLSEFNDEVRLKLLEAAIENGWKSVYPLKAPGKEKADEEGEWV